MAAQQSRHACHVPPVFVAFDDNAIIEGNILWHVANTGPAAGPPAVLNPQAPACYSG